MAKVFSRQDCGCYLDAARGIYIGEGIQELAQLHGWKGEPIGPHPDGPDDEPWSESYDSSTAAAEEYLSSLCDDSCRWEYSEGGDFLLVPHYPSPTITVRVTSDSRVRIISHDPHLTLTDVLDAVKESYETTMRRRGCAPSGARGGSRRSHLTDETAGLSGDMTVCWSFPADYVF